ncbi:histidine phosphatase family protein [Hoyosella altamirensis]|uniref:Broad specificity phosphatase PhoE n=1 Tax=Hoyosella altamirensis TaxID=616997 RepID=A0A839RRW0_9ACTN|nr:histidine phosphatase family protein [Hoyosella altamirensis]MBB3039049.1 broad specificity phosphatase PhoE [Hoyosella altamirensis]
MTTPARVRRLILLRHGQTVYNADARMQGQIDTELSELGVEQAVRAAQVLARCKPSAVLSSDLKRAHDTALALGAEVGIDVITDVRLRETHLGVWQGCTHTEVDTEYPGARAYWRDNATWAPPGGESRVDVARRSVPVVDELLGSDEYADWSTRPIVLVAHGGLIAALTAQLLDLPVSRWPILGGLGNASWVQLRHFSTAEPTSGQWRLDVWNSSAEVAPDAV